MHALQANPEIRDSYFLECKERDCCRNTQTLLLKIPWTDFQEDKSILCTKDLILVPFVVQFVHPVTGHDLPWLFSKCLWRALGVTLCMLFLVSCYPILHRPWMHAATALLALQQPAFAHSIAPPLHTRNKTLPPFNQWPWTFTTRRCNNAPFSPSILLT